MSTRFLSQKQVLSVLNHDNSQWFVKGADKVALLEESSVLYGDSYGKVHHRLNRSRLPKVSAKAEDSRYNRS
jgi:hypothetical protein